MAIGSKQNETRHWPVSYRGLLAIHAAQRLEKDTVWEEPYYEHLSRELLEGSDFLEEENWKRATELIESLLPRMAIVGVCKLVDVVSTNRPSQYLPTEDDDEYFFGNYDRDRYAWVTRDMVALPEPIPYRGQQGMWILESETVADIVAQITLPG
ncbi:MAG: hypothetical protein ABI977_12960 [Acidobacteriota bacterium]